MRRALTLASVTIAAALASCSTTAEQPRRSAAAERELARELAGRTAGPPQRCISNFRSTNMQVIDDWTILFHDGRTVYVQNPRGGCSGIGSHRTTLVTRMRGTTELCDGDFNQLVDLSSGMGGGACVFGPFVPYTKRRG